MKNISMRKIFILFFAVLIFSTFCSAQDYIEDENWLKGFHTEADYFPALTYYQPERFTVEDVKRGKLRLNFVRQFVPKDEWEGIFYGQTAIGDEKFIWNSEGGFFRFYFYHELKSFNFGTVLTSAGFIELNYEKLSIPDINKTHPAKSKLIKVKLGDKHFLVPEGRLQDFCNLAAGLNVKSDDFYYLWTKEEDMEKSAFGLPILPPSYRRFLRNPLEAKIVAVGKKKVIPNEQSTKEYNFDDIHYPITLNAGKNKNLKIGMNFFIEDLGEWIELTKVSRDKSVGFIRRDFDENNQEQCFDGEGGSGQTIPCKEIKARMKVRTKSSL